MTHPTTTAESSEPVAAPADRRRLRWGVLAAVVLAVVGYGVWWVLWSSPVEGATSFGIGFSDVEPGELRSISVADLCVDGVERAVVTAVTVDPAGLEVRDFAVRLRPEPPAVAYGARNGSLSAHGRGWGDTIDAQCDTGRRSEVVIDLVRGVNGPAHTDSVDVHWTAGVRSGVVTTGVQVTLCTTGQVDEYCEEPAAPWAPIPG